ALLKLGGGIAGAIQFLRPGTSSTTGSFGTCLITTTSQDSGAVVDVSKGRLEAAYRVLLNGCGRKTGSVVISKGSSTGNTLLKIDLTSASVKRRATFAFKDVDITTQNVDGKGALAAAGKICTNNDDPDTLEAKRSAAEDAETSIFNKALATATGDAKKAIQCQKDRNKVFKNFCQLLKAQKQNDQAQIDENTKQLTKNTGDVDTRCVGVNTSLFVQSGAKVAKVTTTVTTTTTANSQATGTTSSDNGATFEFKDVDITTQNVDGKGALAAAGKICTNDDSPATLEAKRRAAEDAETSVFNAALATASGDAKKAIQCQKDRNKVFKNFCQLLKAQKQNDQAQIDENTKQLTKNTGDVDTRCVGVNTSLFVQSGATVAAEVTTAAIATTTNAEPTTTEDSQATETASSDNGATFEFKDVDITTQNVDGKGALAAAGKICTNDDSPATLEAKRRAAEDAETSVFNAALATASGDAKKAIQCQKDRNK
ncbi:hypothetical protein HK096_007888, partial [Nowakowskiella sp. JEL0078]